MPGQGEAVSPGRLQVGCETTTLSSRHITASEPLIFLKTAQFSRPSYSQIPATRPKSFHHAFSALPFQKPVSVLRGRVGRRCRSEGGCTSCTTAGHGESLALLDMCIEDVSVDVLPSEVRQAAVGTARLGATFNDLTYVTPPTILTYMFDTMP